MQATDALLQILKSLIYAKADSYTYVEQLKSHFNCKALHFYGIRYEKPFCYPENIQDVAGLFLAIQSAQHFFPPYHIIELSKDSYLMIDGDLPQLSNVDRYLIETTWKTVSYRQYVNFMSLILDHSPDMIAYKDKKQIYRYANKKAIERWPHLDTLIHKHISEVYPSTEVKRITEMDNAVYDIQGPHTSVIEILSEQGFLTVESTRIPVSDGDQIEGIVTINKNITDIKRIENELKRSYDFQDILIQIASIFINVPVEQANEAISRGLGMVGKHIHADRVYVFDYDFERGITNNTHEYCNEGIEPVIDLLQNQPLEMIDAFWMDRHLQRESVYIPDIEQMNHESELYRILKMQDIKSLLTIPLYDEEKIYGFVGFDAVKDYAKWTVDEQKLLKVLAELIVNLKVKQTQQTLLVQEKQNALRASEAKGEFLANMSHEIRTPLSGITNAMYLLKSTELSPEQTDYLEIAKSSVESLSRIVNNILDLAKIEAGKLELEMSSFDLENELYQIIKMQEYVAIEKGLRLLFEFDYDILDEIITDRTRFRQIMLNLVSNAIKYTEKGTVIIKTKKIRQDDHTITIKTEVIDTGIGIPRKVIAKITDPFFQVDSSITKKYPGTGLGLSIVRSLLELLHSDLEIESEMGEGSTFGFTITFASGVRNSLERKHILKDKHFVIFNTNLEHALMAKRFFESMSPHVEIKQDLDVTDRKYDYIIIQKNMEDVERDETQWLLQKLGNKNAKIILCSMDSATHNKRDLLEKSVDYVLSMPTTRERVLQLLTASDQKPSIQSSIDQSILKHKKALVVDDNKVNRQAMQVILSKAGLDVILASSGIEAIERAKLMSLDIILMDIQMPEMDGYEAALKIRSLGGTFEVIPIIAVTANATETANEKALAHGMNRSITKPFKPEMLLEMMKSVFEDQLNQKAQVAPLLDINKTALFEAYDGDASLIYEILKTFADDYHEQSDILKQALQKLDYVTIEKTAHYLKGSTNYIFAEKAAKRCQDIMSLYKQGVITLINDNVEKLILELKTVYDYLVTVDFYRN
jgi:signal transduction histidine kinase/CheY-like chemotaxis protein